MDEIKKLASDASLVSRSKSSNKAAVARTTLVSDACKDMVIVSFNVTGQTIGGVVINNSPYEFLPGTPMKVRSTDSGVWSHNQLNASYLPQYRVVGGAEVKDDTLVKVKE